MQRVFSVSSVMSWLELRGNSSELCPLRLPLYSPRIASRASRSVAPMAAHECCELCYTPSWSSAATAPTAWGTGCARVVGWSTSRTTGRRAKSIARRRSLAAPTLTPTMTMVRRLRRQGAPTSWKTSRAPPPLSPKAEPTRAACGHGRDRGRAADYSCGARRGAHGGGSRSATYSLRKGPAVLRAFSCLVVCLIFT